MVRNRQQEMEALRDFNLAISEETKKYLRREFWSPIMGALLVSGIRPSSRWVDVPPAEGHRDNKPVSHRDLFLELLSSSKVHEHGLDNEQISSDSHRFKSAENILLYWDHVCEARKDYPIDLPPRDFVVWLWGMNRQGNVHIPDSSWLDAFVNNYPLKDFTKFVPKGVLAWLNDSSTKARELSPKHKFGREIATARFEAKQAGDPADDPDEILSRLAEKMNKGEVPGIKLLKYSRKSDIRYRQEGVRGESTLRRDSFARQLRRMIAKDEASGEATGSPVSPDGEGPYIKPVPVDSSDINRFSSNEHLTKLGRDLLGETIAYVRLAANLEVIEPGWPREAAILVGNMVRLSKLLVAIDSLVALKMTEMLALTIPLTIETMVDLKYLIANHDTRLLDSYVGNSAKIKSKDGIIWADLDLKLKAEATGFGEAYRQSLQDASSHLHGSWKDLTEYHLTAVGDEHYRAKLAWSELSPRPLPVICMLAADIAHRFCGLLAGGPGIQKLRKGMEDLHERLNIADEAFSKLLYKRWW